MRELVAWHARNTPCSLEIDAQLTSLDLDNLKLTTSYMATPEMCHSDPPMVQGGFVEAMLDHCSAMAGIAFTRCDCTMPASLEVTTSFLQPTRLNKCTATVKSAVMTYSTAFLEIELYDSVTDAKLATMSTVQKLGRKAISPTFAPFAEQPPFVGKQVVPAPDMTPNIRAITWDDLRSEPEDRLERKYFRLWEAPAKMQAQPMHRLLQQRLLSVSVADQSITMGFVLEEAQTHDGIACGGIVSAFLDQAMTYACFFTSAMSDSKPARSLATISMRTVYLKPLPGPFPKRKRALHQSLKTRSWRALAPVAAPARVADKRAEGM